MYIDNKDLLLIREALERRNELLEEQNKLLEKIDDKLIKIYSGLP